MNIIFQDIDGPLIPARILKEHKGLSRYDLHPTGTKKMDIDFILTLNKLCTIYDYQIVFNTAHNEFGRDYIWNHALDNQFRIDLLHTDLVTGYPTRYYKRMDAITAWLQEHKDVKHWIVIDDYEIADGINHIRPSFQDGMTEDLINKLELTMKGF